MTRPTFFAHRATIVLMAVVVLVATGDGFAQSYAGLYHWATEHHLKSWKADTFPLLVDLFVAVGELGMFALALEGHRLRKSVMSWADVALPFGIAAAGWGVSLVFNVGSVGHRFSDQATAAVPPVASMLGLLVLLRTLHRLVTRDGVAAAYFPVDQSATMVAEPGGDVVDGYARWDEIPAGDLAELPPADQDDQDGDDQGGDQADERGDGDTGSDQGSDRQDDDDQAGHKPPADLPSAVRSAAASGMSERSIAAEFGLTRYRVGKLLADQPQAQATVNGHAVAE